MVFDTEKGIGPPRKNATRVKPSPPRNTARTPTDKPTPTVIPNKCSMPSNQRSMVYEIQLKVNTKKKQLNGN